MNNKSSTKYNIILYSLIIGLVFVLLFSIFLGRYSIKTADFIAIFTGSADNATKNVLLNIRLPRAFCALLCGGALGLSGSIFQKTFKNPLASPDIIGIASGASFGAVVSIVFVSQTIFITQAFSFVFGILSLFLVLIIANTNRENQIFGLIVSGVIINSIASAGVMFLKYTADPTSKLPSIEYFLMGGLYNVRRHHVLYIFLALLFCSIVLYKLRFRLTILSLDDEEIAALGVNSQKTRFTLLFLASILVSTTVSICGVIGFVGLVSPYLAKLLTRNLNRGNMRISFLIGAIVLSVSDIIARTITTSEIPVGIIISLISAPMLIYMLSRGVKNV